MSKILITGGLGYVGYSLVEELLEKEDTELVIYDNHYRKNLGLLFNNNLIGNKVKFIEGDILDERTLDIAFSGVDCVVHLAAKVSTPFAQGDFYMFDYINNWGTSNVVNVAIEHKVKRFVYLSTLSVYGHNDHEINKEDAILSTSDYGKSKYLGEKHLQTLPDFCEKIIVRTGNIFGYNPSIRLDTVVNNFVYKSKFGQKLIINGNGKQSRSFIHIDRLAKQLASLVLSSTFKNDICLLCDYSITVNELIEIIRETIPQTEYTYINPERNMENQVFANYVFEGYSEVSIDHFKEKILNFYKCFSI